MIILLLYFACFTVFQCSLQDVVISVPNVGTSGYCYRGDFILSYFSDDPWHRNCQPFHCCMLTRPYYTGRLASGWVCAPSTTCFPQSNITTFPSAAGPNSDQTHGWVRGNLDFLCTITEMALGIAICPIAEMNMQYAVHMKP